MASFDKLLLLSEDERDQLRQKRIKEFNPQIRTLAFLEEEMEQLLNDTTLDADRKLKLFQAAQSRYELLHQTLPSTSPAIAPALAGITATPAPPTAAPPAAPSSSAAASAALGARIAQIHEFLKGHEDVIRADPASKLELSGVATADNFSNVITFLAEQKHGKAPSSLSDLLSALHSIHFPVELISNKQAKAKYTKLQSGSGRIVHIVNASPSKLSHKRTIKSLIKPPGKKPKILRVY